MNKYAWLNVFNIFVAIPILLFAIYLLIIASPRYESQTKMIIKEPDGMATLEPSLAMLSGFGGSGSSSDAELVKAFIYSNDMLIYLEAELNLTTHYENSEFDFFSRLSSDASIEKRLEYFQNRVLVNIDEKSMVISVNAQAFESNFANQLTSEIIARAEWYINEIGHNLAKAQLDFVQQEHEIVTQKLQQAKSKLLTFQNQYNLLDPEAEGIARQQIAYGLESVITNKNAELRALRNSMSENAPLVVQAKEQLQGLIEQLDAERQLLTKNESANQQDLGVGEILTRFTDYKINMELALQAYTSSQVSLEKSRIQAYRQLKYLVVVESPTIPEDARYPKVFYNLSLFSVVILMLFGIGKIILATVEELR
jgi:capsular polysaccharide transport system permease protein